MKRADLPQEVLALPRLTTEIPAHGRNRPTMKHTGWMVLPVLLGGLLGSGPIAPSPAQAQSQRLTPVVQAIQKARPAVVAIRSQRHLDRPGDARLGPPQRIEGMGAGIILHPSGYILTNHHVVAGVERIFVTLADGQTFQAQRIASDAGEDLAVIRIRTPGPLTPILPGTSSDLMLGEPAIAIGNPFGYDHTITRGIVSALHRRVQVNDELIYEDLIQTDAAINPGNSGGPLLNADGEMIGVTVAVRAGAQGIGFAIPVDRALVVAARLLAHQAPVKHGIRLRYSATRRHWVVGSLLPGSPAVQAGLRRGDRILEVAGQAVSHPVALQLALQSRRPGESVKLLVQRGDRTHTLTLLLESSARKQPDRVWAVLGLKLEPVQRALLQRYRVPYRGGLRVLQVRTGSPADRQGLKPGDILVGIHVWETLRPEHVQYILSRPDLDKLQPLKFYVVRGGETFYGHLQVDYQRR